MLYAFLRKCIICASLQFLNFEINFLTTSNKCILFEIYFKISLFFSFFFFFLWQTAQTCWLWLMWCGKMIFAIISYLLYFSFYSLAFNSKTLQQCNRLGKNLIIGLSVLKRHIDTEWYYQNFLKWKYKFKTY